MLINHYFEHAWRSFRRTSWLTALIILAIGLGIGASMTMVTVLHVMSGDPLPDRSSKLFYPHLEPSSSDYMQFNPGNNFTWPDAINLLQSHQAAGQAMMAPGRVAVSTDSNVKPFFNAGHYVSTEFFRMFGTPFAAGSAWDAHADTDHAPVVVLNGELAVKLYGSAAAAIDQTVKLQDHDFRVVGVLRNWHPEPVFYGGSSGDWAFKSQDGFFLPLTTAMALKLPIGGGETCWGDGDRMSDKCAWLQFWVELDTPEQVATYQQFLFNYWRDQKAHGRFPLNINPDLYGMMQRLRALNLVPANVSLQLWLAIAFLGVCLFNTVSLMLAKFLRRSEEVSIRRAMGASKRDVFLQFGAEAAVLGIVGGVLGLLFTGVGLWLVHQRPDAYAKLAQLDTAMVLSTFALAVVASVLAGLLPAWRACRIPPALQL